MASPAQIAANRANAQKSTGPRTAEGKKRASMSALKHGLTAQRLVLPHEDNLAYGEIRESLYNQYQPATEQECMLVDQLTSAWWRTLRVRQIETDMFDLQIQTLNHTYPEKEKTKTTDRQALAVRFVTESEKDFVNFMRYDAQIERAFYRALNTLEKIQAARRREEQRALASEIGFVPSPQPTPSQRRTSAGVAGAPACSSAKPTNDNVIGFVSHPNAGSDHHQVPALFASKLDCEPRL